MPPMPRGNGEGAGTSQKVRSKRVHLMDVFTMTSFQAETGHVTSGDSGKSLQETLVGNVPSAPAKVSELQDVLTTYYWRFR